MSVEITVLLENTKPAQSDYEVEHGLSLLVKTEQSEFIFDCGQTGIAWNNAALMGIDLSKIQFVILSHSHYDHAAGFPSLLKYVSIDKLYTGINFWRKKFSYNADSEEYKYSGCGFNEEELSNWNINQVVCKDLIKLDDDTWLISNFVKKYEFETIPSKFVCGEDKRPDDFSDEIVLVIRESDGVAIITGCAHNGILNIVTTIQQRFNLPVYSVIGGIHLKGLNEERIIKTIDELKKIGVKRFALCHCSGEEVHKYLLSNEIMDYKISTGSIIKFE